MEKSDADPSHQLVTYWNDYADMHESQWKCAVCEESACQLCPLEDYDALAEPCIGFSWLKALAVKGDDGVTHRVKSSGTGWPELRKATRG